MSDGERRLDHKEQKLRYEGQNYTADAVIFDPDVASVLLILRSSGIWGIPGGFIDPEDPSPAAAALREVSEEATDETPQDGRHVYSGRVTDPRNSEARWIETSAYRFTLPLTARLFTDDELDKNEVIAVKWWGLDELPEQLYGSHAMLIKRALDYTMSERLLETSASIEDHIPVSGGFMGYEKSIDETGTVFTKHLPPPGEDSNAKRREQMLEYLKKEQGIMAHLRIHGYPYAPEASVFHDDKLVMPAYRAEDGWQWQATPETFDTYVQGALAALTELESIPLPPDVFDVEPSYESILREGWGMFNRTTTKKLSHHINDIPPHLIASATALLQDIPDLRTAADTFATPDKLVLCHGDMRQDNLAWHPEKGVRLIDSSWTGPMLPGSDATTLLIDLYKSGYDVSDYLGHINRRHCYDMMGFWLAHSTLPSHGAPGLRAQQFISAINAYELLLATAAQQ